jgi:hypothetical protein
LLFTLSQRKKETLENIASISKEYEVLVGANTTGGPSFL